MSTARTESSFSIPVCQCDASRRRRGILRRYDFHPARATVYDQSRGRGGTGRYPGASVSITGQNERYADAVCVPNDGVTQDDQIETRVRAACIQ